MPDYAAYFLGSKSNVVYLETLQISHPDFTRTYWIVRNAIGGLTADLEGGVSQVFEYYPLRIRAIGSNDDLEQSLQIDLGDLGELIPSEIDAVAEAGTMGIKPTVTYRAWRSDDLTEPLVGPVELELADISSNQEGSSFEARAASLNVNRTGKLYRIEDFPMLRGFLT